MSDSMRSNVRTQFCQLSVVWSVVMTLYKLSLSLRLSLSVDVGVRLKETSLFK